MHALVRAMRSPCEVYTARTNGDSASLEMAADLLADSDGILLCETGSGLGGFIATSFAAGTCWRGLGVWSGGCECTGSKVPDQGGAQGSRDH